MSIFLGFQTAHLKNSDRINRRAENTQTACSLVNKNFFGTFLSEETFC